MRSFPFRRRKESSLEASKPYIWQEDERRVRDGSCHFSVKVTVEQNLTTVIVAIIFWKYWLLLLVPQPFYGPFSGTTRLSRCQPKNFWTLEMQRKINRGRHTDHSAGRHSIRTKQCPPPPSPDIFYGPDALPAAQPTASKHWRQLAHSD